MNGIVPQRDEGSAVGSVNTNDAKVRVNAVGLDVGRNVGAAVDRDVEKLTRAKADNGRRHAVLRLLQRRRGRGRQHVLQLRDQEVGGGSHGPHKVRADGAGAAVMVAIGGHT